MIEPHALDGELEPNQQRLLEIHKSALRRRRWSRSLTPVNVFVGFLLLVLVTCSGIRHYRAAQRRAHTAEMGRQRLQLEAWIHDLKVPDAVLYCDQEAMLKVARLRREMYRREGVTELRAYEPLKAFDGASAELPPAEHSPELSDEQLVEISFETSSRRHAAEACLAIAHALETGESVSGYLRERRYAYEGEVEPLLLRMLQGEFPPETDWLRVTACRALLAGGNRSMEVRMALKQLLGKTSRQTPIDPDAQAEAQRLTRLYRLKISADMEAEYFREGQS